LSLTCHRSVVFCGYHGFLYQYNWQPRYNWYIVESGAKHHKPNQTLVHNLMSKRFISPLFGCYFYYTCIKVHPCVIIKFASYLLNAYGFLRFTTYHHYIAIRCGMQVVVLWIKQNVIHTNKTGNENEIFSKIMIPICDG
jgi:hypothetical protein